MQLPLHVSILFPDFWLVQEGAGRVAFIHSFVCLFACLSIYFSVSESTDLKGPVSIVIERELKTLLDSRDLKQCNSNFLEQNSQSLLHRLSGNS